MLTEKKTESKSFFTGRVIEEQKNYFLVDVPEGRARGRIRGLLKKRKTRICSGDIVDIELINRQPLEGIITHLHERKSFLPRPALANIDYVFFIHTIKEPQLDLEALDRFLFSSEVYNFKPFIVLNKIDLLTDKERLKVDFVKDIYQKIGYKILCTSALTEEGIEDLILLCKNHISAFTGLSGAGKSTLLSKIFPENDFRIGKISVQTQRGTHTTTNTTLHRLESGGYIADTPGLSIVDIPEIPEDTVVNYFPELYSIIGQCRFNNCTHNGEPGCFIQELLENNEVSSTRILHYRKIYKDTVERRRKFKNRS